MSYRRQILNLIKDYINNNKNIKILNFRMKDRVRFFNKNLMFMNNRLNKKRMKYRY